MKNFNVIIIFINLLFSDGPFTVDTISEQDGLRNGPEYTSGIVYYPTNAEGPLPIIVMVPGFVSLISSIDDWGPYLASHGVVTMFVNVIVFLMIHMSALMLYWTD